MKAAAASTRVMRARLVVSYWHRPSVAAAVVRKETTAHHLWTAAHRPRDFVTAAATTTTTTTGADYFSTHLSTSTKQNRKKGHLLSSFVSNKTTNNSLFFSTDSTANDVSDTKSTTTTAPPPISLKQYYHIEASNNNPERSDATKLTVHGPDVDGILASMTVALAVQQGCSLMELHAAMADDVGHAKVYDDTSAYYIHDVFWVVQRDSGQPFPDDRLQDLAECLLEAAAAPLTVVTSCSDGGKPSSQALMQAYLEEKKVPIPKQQITVIPSSSSSSSSSDSK